MSFSDEAARRYIQGEQFDPVEYERQHLIRLKESAGRALTDNNPMYLGNLVNTVSHWVELHKDTIHKEELNSLVEVLNHIKEEKKEYDKSSD